VVKAAAVRLVSPSAIPLGGPCHGEAFEHVVVADLDGVAFDYDVESSLSVVAPGRENHMRVGSSRWVSPWQSETGRPPFGRVAKVALAPAIHRRDDHAQTLPSKENQTWQRKFPPPKPRRSLRSP
jgi:hypothetical protein